MSTMFFRGEVMSSNISMPLPETGPVSAATSQPLQEEEEEEHMCEKEYPRDDAVDHSSSQQTHPILQHLLFNGPPPRLYSFMKAGVNLNLASLPFRPLVISVN